MRAHFQVPKAHCSMRTHGFTCSQQTLLQTRHSPFSPNFIAEIYKFFHLLFIHIDFHSNHRITFFVPLPKSFSLIFSYQGFILLYLLFRIKIVYLRCMLFILFQPGATKRYCYINDVPELALDELAMQDVLFPVRWGTFVAWIFSRVHRLEPG